MEAIYLIIGLAMFYSWIHGIIIISKNMKKMTSYEKAVVITGLAVAGLYIIETL